MVEVEIKKFTKVEEKVELTQEEKELRKKRAFKRNIVLSSTGALMILILILCIFFVYIPNNTQRLEITSFEGNTTFIIKDFKLGKYPDRYQVSTSFIDADAIEVKDPNKFYEKYLKQYTIDEFESTKEKGYLFYEGSCFKYRKSHNTVYGYYYELSPAVYGYNGMSFIAPYDGFFATARVDDFPNYSPIDFTYTEFINFLSHVDDRYYKVQDGKYYLKAYSGTRFISYLELREIDDDFCLLVIRYDNGDVIDGENPLVF